MLSLHKIFTVLVLFFAVVQSGLAENALSELPINPAFESGQAQDGQAQEDGEVPPSRQDDKSPQDKSSQTAEGNSKQTDKPVTDKPTDPDLPDANASGKSAQDKTQDRQTVPQETDPADPPGNSAPETPPNTASQPSGATINSHTEDDGSRTIIIKSLPVIPEPELYYSALVRSTATVGLESIQQVANVTIKMIQGKAKFLSLELKGDAHVTSVTGPNLKAWGVRQEDTKRFLDLTIVDDIKEVKVKVILRSQEYNLDKPVALQLSHFAPAKSVGFDSVVSIRYASGLNGTVTDVSGFVPLKSATKRPSFQSATGGHIKLKLSQAGGTAEPIALSQTTLNGTVHPNGDSVLFHFGATVQVTKPNAEITILSGHAAVTKVPTNANYRLKLATGGNRAVYKLKFLKAGTFPVALDFVAAIRTASNNVRSLDFTVAASAVVPLKLDGLKPDLEFHRGNESVMPIQEDDHWLGFLPATGRAKLSWKTARTTGDGKLFFSTTAQIDATVGAGLLRQQHQVNYQVLQGELKSISIVLQGPGEILDVQGTNIIGWKVSDQGQDRLLEATLSQPVTGTSQVIVRTQTPLNAFPVRVEGLRLAPVGTIRHSGFLRLTNTGAVRLEPTDLKGLTQLAPEQFPAAAVKARQTFVYRFPAADHAFTVAADRIEPEVNVSELVVYQLAETDRIIKADVELDIRDAGIRDWNFDIPADYSVVSVTGNAVADYIPASTVTDERRNLKVVFAKDVIGRQLVTFTLEKSQAAAPGNWVLPPIQYPEAKTVRGTIGVIGAAGYRIAISETNLLVEKPLSYFPKSAVGLQQAFRIREPDWSATMKIEVLDRSVQADVFHLYSLSEETVYGSALLNYFVTGSPVSEWAITVPESMGNVIVDGQDVRTWRREGDLLIVSLHQPVMGAYTLLVTFEEKPDQANSTFQPGQIAPVGVQGERGYIQVVSPMQVDLESVSISDDILKLDPLELPAEFRLLSSAPALGTWQYTSRPIDLSLKAKWFEAGTMATQVVEYSEANTRVSQDGQLVTDILYYVKSRGRRTFKLQIPPEPVRLWAVTVNNQPVTARQAEDGMLIPLPGGTDTNVPIEIRLRLGKPTVSESSPKMTLPVVAAPVLKTEWNISADEHHVLVPTGGTVTPPVPVLRPTGFEWTVRNGIVPLLIIGLLTCLGIWTRHKPGYLKFVGLASFTVAMVVAVQTANTAYGQQGSSSPLQLSLPILAAGETVQIQVSNIPVWRIDLSWLGLAAVIGGIAAIGWSMTKQDQWRQLLSRGAGVLLISLGILLQGAAAPWFFGLLAIAIFLLLFIRPAIDGIRETWNCTATWIAERRKNRQAKRDAASAEPSSGAGSVTASLLFLAIAFSSTVGQAADSTTAALPSGFEAADSIVQQWQVGHTDSRLKASGKVTLTGRPGDQFVLLRSPAVLTNFEGEGLRLSKQNLKSVGLVYTITIPLAEEESSSTTKTWTADFEFQLDAVKLSNLPVYTGMAAVQEIDFSYDEAGWDVVGSSAMRVEQVPNDSNATQAKLLLGPGSASIVLKPRARDIASEETQFFVEASNLFLPGPGVVDGRHRLDIRTSQGQVNALNVLVPKGLTVSAVNGPVGAWQFDADTGNLKLQVDSVSSQAFSIMIETQRGLDPLPADVTLAPLKVVGANGQVGLVAIAFGSEAQPDTLEAEGMSAVHLGDFDTSLMPKQNAVLHRVYRYGAEGGQLAMRVAAVESEVRVISRQVLSLGDERVILAVNFAAEISRAGRFQLSFPLPDGLEIESLTGSSLHHWAELSEEGQRQIILHLNGKTLGPQKFSLTLSGRTPTNVAEWKIPRFILNESARQSGELVVRPTTGIRLRTIARQNVSEIDPRTMGGKAQGALAFRLLQRDWDLTVGIEKLDPWVTGQVLHEITLREGQTRAALMANFVVQNASVNSLRIELPMITEDEVKTLRATGHTVSDLIRTSPDSNVWEVQFKRRVVGKVQFRIEYERRGDGVKEEEILVPAEFPQARQLSYYFAVRAGGRLELEHTELTQGWHRIDWNSVPQPLREAENRSVPALAFRALAPEKRLTINSHRHSLADSLKLRVAKANLTTVLSASGDQITSVDVVMDVIQRSSLSVGLPKGSELLSIFVNGESVNSIRNSDSTHTWQFYILPGMNDRTASVQFIYTVPANRLANLNLSSPELNVPLENIQWNVIAPKGFQLNDSDGNLELIGQTNQKNYDRDSYLSKASGTRRVQAAQAAELLEQANQLLQAGEQSKAHWALKSVANQYALDAASNEDARIQLENLETQQAIVGLNSRRQRLYLDNGNNDADMIQNEELRQAAVANPILQQDRLNFRPGQLSQLLKGNSTADNAILMQIAARLVRHQHATEPAPQAIIISLPEEGDIYTFERSVQVAENAPLELDLDFDSKLKLPFWQIAAVLLLLTIMAAGFTFSEKKLSSSYAE